MKLEQIISAVLDGIIVGLLLSFLIWLGGCDVLAQFAADPDASGAAEQAVEGAAWIASLLGPFGGIVAGALSTGLLIWRRVKPALATAKTKAAQYHAAGATVVTALETFKALHPKQWEILGKLIEDQLQNQGIDPLMIENVIRGMRGLGPKEIVG
jgi:hypothetical protein